MFSKTPEILSLVLFGVFFVGILGLGFLRDVLCVFFGFEGAWRFFCGVLVLVLFCCFSIKQLLYLYLVLPMLWLKGNKKERRGLQTLIFVGWRDKYHHYSQPQEKASSRYPETVTSVTPKVNWRLILSALLQCICSLDICMCLHNWPNPTQVCCREDKQPPIQTQGGGGRWVTPFWQLGRWVPGCCFHPGRFTFSGAKSPGSSGGRTFPLSGSCRGGGSWTSRALIDYTEDLGSSAARGALAGGKARAARGRTQLLLHTDTFSSQAPQSPRLSHGRVGPPAVEEGGGKPQVPAGLQAGDVVQDHPRVREVDRGRHPRGSLPQPRADEKQPLGGERKMHHPLRDRPPRGTSCCPRSPSLNVLFY